MHVKDGNSAGIIENALLQSKSLYVKSL